MSETNEASVQSVVHTPGPWVTLRWTKNNGEDRIAIASKANTKSLCSICNDATGLPLTQQDLANAKLIAAAPMMLAACMDVAKTMEDTQIYAPELAILRAAIRQAVGEQV